MSVFHYPTATERLRSAEAVAAHLPKLKKADEIISDLHKFADDLPNTETGIPLFTLHSNCLQFLGFMKERWPQEIDNLAAHLSDALGDSLAQKRYNDAIEGAENDRINGAA